MTNAPAINEASKSQLAKLLAVENITVQHQSNASTASFDVVNRVLTLPVWKDISNDLYDMLVVHEVGHALDTPADGWVDAISDIAKKFNGNVKVVKDYLNVIEDARIDKRQKRRFPGARRNYVFGYRELIERDFFDTGKRDINTFSFIDRANMYFKGGAMMGIKFTDEENIFIDRMANAETFEEVLALTEEIYSWSKEKAQTQQDDMTESSGFGAGSDEDENEDSQPMPSNTDGDGDEETDADETADGGSDGDEPDESAGNGDDEDETGDKNVTSNGIDPRDNPEPAEAPRALTEEAWQEKQADIVQYNDNIEYVYVGLPTPNLDKMVDDYKVVLAEQSKAIAASWVTAEWKATLRKDLQNFKVEENASISFMVKEFEMKKAADQHKRTSVAKTGVIDVNKLHKYKYSDDIFLRQAIEATGKNHGFVLIMDWSGSMGHNLKKTVKQLISLSLFCKRVQIPFEVYIFRDDGRYDAQSWTYKDRDFTLAHFKLRNILSSRMSLVEFNEALFNLWFAGTGQVLTSDIMNGTPLNEAIVAASYVVNQFRARAKVQVVNTIFLTDGGASPPGIHNQGMAGWSRKFTRYIIQDSVTKKSYDTGKTGRLDAANVTGKLLENFKDRTGSNLIGFYIYETGTFARVTSNFMFTLANDQTAAMWKDNGFVTAKDSGYDEYYILNPNNMDIRSNNLNVNDTMSTNKIAKEFAKFSAKKTVNRVLLSNFVEKIVA